MREALGAPQMGWLLAVLGTVIRQSKVGAEYLHPSGWKGHDLGPLRTRRRIPNHLRWARYPLLGVQTYLAGAHGQRRIPGQSVNLAHLIWRKPCAPVPLLMYPRWFSTRGYWCCSPLRWGEGSAHAPMSGEGSEGVFQQSAGMTCVDEKQKGPGSNLPSPNRFEPQLAPSACS